jgi:hypothetical protein
MSVIVILGIKTLQPKNEKEKGKGILQAGTDGLEAE